MVLTINPELETRNPTCPPKHGVRRGKQEPSSKQTGFYRTASFGTYPLEAFEFVSSFGFGASDFS
jgi:hypothetical protein